MNYSVIKVQGCPVLLQTKDELCIVRVQYNGLKCRWPIEAGTLAGLFIHEAGSRLQGVTCPKEFMAEAVAWH